MTLHSSGAYYNYYNGDREIVTQARIYDLLSRLDPNHPPDAAFVRCLRRELLDPWQEAKSAIQFSADKKVGMAVTPIGWSFLIQNVIVVD